MGFSIPPFQDKPLSSRVSIRVSVMVKIRVIRVKVRSGLGSGDN